MELTEEQRMIRDTAREFCEREIAPLAREADRRGSLDPELPAKIAAMGYIGAIVGAEHGGGGLDYRSYGLICEELGRVDSSARTLVSVGTSLVARTIEAFGTEAQRERWLGPICAGEAVGCFCLTEPDSGSDAAALRTRARKVDGGWEISGQKMWISLGNAADVALVFARSEDRPGARGVSCFLVPTAAEGFAAAPITGKLGMRASDVASVSLDGVRVGDDAMLGEPGRGFRVAMTALESGRFSVAAAAVGICQGALDAALAYASERRQFDRPLAGFQLVQRLLTRISVDMQGARALTWRAGELKDLGRPNAVETSTAKLFATEAAIRCADAAIQVHGGAGYVDDHPVERLWRDARVTTLYEGTTQVQELIIGRELTGINALVPDDAIPGG